MNIGGRRYKVNLPGVEGLFLTFRPSKSLPSATEMELEQYGLKLVFSPTKSAADPKLDIQVDELLAKALTAQGGEAALRRIKTRIVKSSVVIETQGLRIGQIEYARAPYCKTTVQRITAINKCVATLREYFNGKSGGSESSFSADVQTPESRIAEGIASAYLFPELDWKSRYTQAVITGKEKVGAEDVYVVRLQPPKGEPIVDYISTTTFHVLRRKVSTFSPDAGGVQEQTTDYQDFRKVGGIVMPFREIQPQSPLGEVKTTIQSVRFDRALSDAVFEPKAAQAPDTDIEP